MISSEEQLLDEFRESGFDFTSTVGEMAHRFPKELDWGVPSCEVLPFRLERAFAGLGAVWKIPVNRELEFDLPPARYFHEFHPSNEVRENFDRALKQLTALFGAGRSGESTNVYERSWQIGFFTIQLISWPRELNSTLHNVFEGRNPYLWISANIYIVPAFPFIEPTEDAGESIEELLLPSETCKLVCGSRVYGRRNRVSAPAGTLVAGLAGNAFLIRAQDTTVRVPLEEIQKVLLTRLTSGDYPGSSSVSLETLFLNRHKVSVSVATGSETHSLDEVAKHLSQAIGKPLAVEEYRNDR
jgi:hypothetical protein